MENNYSYSGSGVQTAQVTLMKSLYLWMSVALAVTGITAMAVDASYQLQQLLFSGKYTFLVLVVAELALVIPVGTYSPHVVCVCYGQFSGLLFLERADPFGRFLGLYKIFDCIDVLCNGRNFCRHESLRVFYQERLVVMGKSLFYGAYRIDYCNDRECFLGQHDTLLDYHVCGSSDFCGTYRL